MPQQVIAKFQEHFDKLEDPRIDRHKLYPLTEIMFVLLCGSICGAESWRDFVMFGGEKLDFLRTYFPFESGIPCKNTFARVCASIDPEQFRACFMGWTASLKAMPQEVIAIDGKTLCNSADKDAQTAAIHMVSAFGTESRLVLAQQKVAEKSNEITAIPVLLDMLDIKGHTITIDAMGCQRNIAQKIQDKGADYVLALKGNQGTLNDDVRLFLETQATKPGSTAISDTYTHADAGHGRVEQRTCIVSDQLDWLTQKPEWSGLKSVAMIEETRDINGKISTDRRFFISSLPANAQQIAQAVRAHWAIENVLHWTLDVVFNEDQSRVRKDHAPQNMAIVRHVVLNMLNNAKKHFKNLGPKAMRKKAGWGNDNLRTILTANF
jgi:predicted transposase YbfD/YdcC